MVDPHHLGKTQRVAVKGERAAEVFDLQRGVGERFDFERSHWYLARGLEIAYTIFGAVLTGFKLSTRLTNNGQDSGFHPV
jgi:hypothetical protein